MIRIFLGIFLMMISLSIKGQFDSRTEAAAIQYAAQELSKMSQDEKIGQLFMIRAHSDKGPDHIKEVERQIKTHKVGGLCFFQGTPQKQAELTQKYQNLSKRPLMIAIDAEWGLGMRFKDKDAMSFPKQMTLGAIDDNDMIYEMGREIAWQLKQIGAHINFAPVVDVNNNAANPVIHDRSFGEDKYNVATKSYAYMKGLQEEGIMACAKHFPGHGDTDVDSHYDLPLIKHDMDRITSVELMPFRVLSQLGVGSMMTAHLQVPAIDDRENRPLSLSEKAIRNILMEDLGFGGLIFTDGLEMHGVAKHFKPGFMEVEALNAGNDVMLLPIDIDVAVSYVKKAVQVGTITQADLDFKVAKILKAKYQLGLKNKPLIPNITGIPKKVNRPEAIAIKSALYQKAITLVKDDNNILPLKNVEGKRVATLEIGSTSRTDFQKTMSDLMSCQHFNINKTFTESEKRSLLQKLASYDLVFVGLHDMNIYANKDYGLNSEIFNLLFSLNTQNKIVTTVYGTPYVLKYLHSLPSIVVAYEDDPIVQKLCAQAYWGINSIEGKLPVSVAPHFKVKDGIKKSAFMKLGYALPEQVNINSDTLLKIDSLVDKMISEEAAPGCQIMGIKDGKIFFNRSYGHHTYDKKIKVENDHIYDVASITKILSTTISLMKLYEEGKINLSSPLRSYIPGIDTTNKSDLIIEDILAHQAGLPAWIAFYENTVESKNKKVTALPEYYSTVKNDNFDTEVAHGLYLRSDFRDSIYHRIYDCELKTKKYRYSDLGFYMFQKVIENITQMPLEEYVDQTFYRPMGLRVTGYNPLLRHDKNRIAPTEEDSYFRNQTLQGHVHDMGAAMLGGVAGHAGLFSNTTDLAVLMQMLLNGGQYGGIQYLKTETIQKFTHRYHDSTRRGLGFDMKELNEDKTENMSEFASDEAFGHLGFTGASIFADPKENFIYIFLSNRTFPSYRNNKLGKHNYRPKIQSVFYQAMQKNIE